MSLPIYLDDKLYEIKKFNIENIFGKKIILFENYYDIDYLLKDMYINNNNINGLIVDCYNYYKYADYLINFEKKEMPYDLNIFNYVLENHNNKDSVFVLRASKLVNYEKFMNEYIGTFIYIYSEHFFNKLVKDNVYQKFDLVLIYSITNYCSFTRRIFEKIECEHMCDLIKYLKKNGLDELVKFCSPFSNIIFDTKCENLYLQDLSKEHFNNYNIKVKNRITDKFSDNDNILNLLNKHKTFYLHNYDYKNISISLLKKDFFRFSKLHSWYKHINFEGQQFYYYLKKGEQVRNILENDVEDSEEIHWHFSENKPENTKYGEIIFGPFLRGELHGFDIIRNSCEKIKFEKWIEDNYPEFYIPSKIYTELNLTQQQKIVNNEFNKYWNNLKESYLKTFF